MTESALVVAAPPRVGGSSNDSQPPIQRPRPAGPTNESVVSLSVPDVHSAKEAEAQDMRAQVPSLDMPLGVGTTAVALLMQLGSELLVEFNKTLEAAMTRFSSPTVTSPRSAGDTRPVLTPDTAQALLGDIKLHVAIHEGELTTAVVGRLRPRFKYYGGAVRGAKEACSGFQVTGLVATPRVGRQLEEAGFKALMPISVNLPVASRASTEHHSFFSEGGELDRLYLIDWQRLEEGWGSINPYARSAAWERPEDLVPAIQLVEDSTPQQPPNSSSQVDAMAMDAAAARGHGGLCLDDGVPQLQQAPMSPRVVSALKTPATPPAAARTPAQGPQMQPAHSSSLDKDPAPHELLSLQLQLVSMQQQLAALAQRAPSGSVPLSNASSGELGGQGAEGASGLVRSKSANASRPGQLTVGASRGGSGQSTPTGESARSRLGQLFKRKSKKREGVESSGNSVLGN